MYVLLFVLFLFLLSHITKLKKKINVHVHVGLLFVMTNTGMSCSV